MSDIEQKLLEQQHEIEMLNKKIDQLLEEIDYRELNKNVNLI